MEILNNLHQLEHFLKEKYERFKNDNRSKIRACKINTLLGEDNSIAIKELSDDLLEINLNGKKLMFPLTKY